MGELFTPSAAGFSMPAIISTPSLPVAAISPMSWLYRPASAAGS